MQTPGRHRWLTLAVLNLSLFAIVMNNTILNVAIPTLARELAAGGSDLQWMVDSYVLVFAGLLLTAGAVGDRFGRRGALSAGLTVFGLGSVAAMGANSAASLIAARAVMGVGAALIMPATLSILTNVFTDPAERAKAIGIWATVGGLAVAIGPILGGWLLEHFAWSSVFAINIPVVVAAIIAGRPLVPTSRDPEAPPLDIPGALLSIIGLGSLVWAIIEAGEQGWTSGAAAAGFAAAAATLVGFVAWERRTDHPMLDMAFFRNRRFTAASLGVMLAYFSMFGAMFLLSQLLQFVLGYSALEAGVRILPFALAMAVFAPVSTKLAATAGSRAVVAAGMATAAAGLLWAAGIGHGGDYGDYLPAMIVMGAGVALTWAPATESIMGSLPPAKAGVGSAVNDTVREVGGALGVAVLGSIVGSRYAGSVATATSDLPDTAAHVARDSLGGAVVVAQQVGGDAGAALLDAARSAYVDGLGLALLIGAVVALAGSAVAAIWLPAEAPSIALDQIVASEAEPAAA